MECGEIDLAHVLLKQQGKPINLNFIRLYWEQVRSFISYRWRLKPVFIRRVFSNPINFIVFMDEPIHTDAASRRRDPSGEDRAFRSETRQLLARRRVTQVDRFRHRQGYRKRYYQHT